MQEKTQSMMIKLSFYGATVGKKMEVLGVVELSNFSNSAQLSLGRTNHTITSSFL